MGLDQWLMRSKDSGEHDEVIYWRKENQFHKWFIDHCAPENYEYEKQEPIPVTKQDIQDLLTTIKELLDKFNELQVSFSVAVNPLIIESPLDQWIDLCKKKLPTQSGFFFGSTEYNECYYESLKSAAERLELIIDDWDDSFNYTYETWW